MRKGLWVLAVIALGVLLAACTSSEATPAVQSAADVSRIRAVDAKAMLDDGTAVPYDTRSLNQFRSQRAAGAVSFPEGEEAARFGELSTEKTLIFYCT